MFKSIEVADHIGETNRDHANYINERGQTIPVAKLIPLLSAGTGMCFECNDQFINNYRLWEHMIYEGHTKNVNNGIYGKML